MIRLNSLDAGQLPEFSEMYSAESAARDLMEKGRNAAEDRVSLRDLHAYAIGAIAYPDARIDRAMDGSEDLRAAFQRLVTDMAVWRSGEAMAASDEDIPPRRHDGFDLRAPRSKSDPDHFYIIIEIATGALADWPEHATLMIFDRDRTCHRFPLPPARNSFVQFQVHESDKLVALLRDTGLEVVIR